MRLRRAWASTLGLVAILAAGLTAGLPAAAEMVYHRGNNADPETLDQHKTSTVYEANILRDLYEGLVVYDAAAQLMPGVAESWELSDDGRTYTFRLRADAKWSNGDPVTAGDFVYSLRRIMTPETGAKYANVLYPIANAAKIHAGELPVTELGVAARDDRTLEVTLEAPTPFFLELLTHQTGLPVHPPSVEAHGPEFVRTGNIVSNGAYVLANFVPNAQVKLTKNPEFHAADSVRIDTVYYYPTEDRSAALRRFQAGELHSNNDAPVEQVAWMKENSATTTTPSTPASRSSPIRGCARRSPWPSTGNSSPRRSGAAPWWRATASCRPALPITAIPPSPTTATWA
jgi:oligopeptide transport system substrate-binding protein